MIRLNSWLNYFSGYKTVITPASHLYLDHPEEPDSNERGYYWATRYTDMRNIFSFQVFTQTIY